MERCLILAAKHYSFTAADGRLVEGANLTYLTAEVERQAGRRGMEPLTAPATEEVYASLGELPAVGDLDFRQRPGLKGRPTLTVVGVASLKPVDLAGPLRSVA